MYDERLVNLVNGTRWWFEDLHTLMNAGIILERQFMIAKNILKYD